ncbi:uncharacterized protein G2W53_018438 [Senna tora]|uniref:Uncharacterized protein n=1 Tax=Senna tora TaxID=362788 RepID=A0A834TT39_9FABA|nr:uncharacterized protein G2W53_018438 [Senna tora]
MSHHRYCLPHPTRPLQDGCEVFSLQDLAKADCLSDIEHHRLITARLLASKSSRDSWQARVPGRKDRDELASHVFYEFLCPNQSWLHSERIGNPIKEHISDTIEKVPPKRDEFMAWGNQASNSPLTRSSQGEERSSDLANDDNDDADLGV